MAVTKLFRIFVRQRVRWTTGSDSSVIENVKPTETEGNSVERDITDYVASYKLPRSREVLSSELSLKLLSPQGLLNPENHKSAMNLSPLDGVTFTPLLAEGNEILVYRITDPAYLDPSLYRSDPTKWIPRFRGIIRGSSFSTEQGQDTLDVTAGDILSRATKATISGTFSPVIRTSSAIPANSFYTQATLTAALTKLRTTNANSFVSETYSDLATPYEVGEITSDTLARLIFWDRDDLYFAAGFAIGKSPRFVTVNGQLSESAEAVMPYPAVTPDTARALYQLSGSSWLVDGGTVIKDATRPFGDSLGSLKLVGGVLRFTASKLPVNSPSKIRVQYRIENGTDSFNIKITRRLWNPTTQAWDATWDAKSDRIILNNTITGSTVFSAANLGGTCLNDPGNSPTTYEFRLLDIDVPSIDPSYQIDPATGGWIVYDAVITATGTVWIDYPRWEFTIVDRDAITGNAVYKETNITNMTRLERWTTQDGIVYSDPYQSHCSLMPKNLRVVCRRLRAPYFAGTQLGYGPTHLKNRYLPESYMYETELVEGQDYTVLVDKGAIELSSALTRVEIFVAHGYNDLSASSHMEASNMLTYMLQKGAGIPNVSLETTGIILNKIELGIKTTTTVTAAIQDLLKQLPGNYHIFADGNGMVWGRFVQQEGSPRIFNPIIQAPILPLTPATFPRGKELWYSASNLMADGKETLISNLMSTVEYQNYYDAAHISKVTPNQCPVLQLKMAPNAVGLVIRRATAYKTVADMGAAPSLTPKIAWDFNSATTPLVASTGTGTLVDSTSAFHTKLTKEVNSDAP